MSIFHLTVRSVSRASGRSAVAAAAYRAGERLTNDRDGRVHDYTGKPVVEAFILAPDDAPPWTFNRGHLWNAVEATERRKDAKVAREYELALPAGLAVDERRRLAEAFARQLVDRYGVAVDVAIHPPSSEGDQRNHHAHLLTTTRVLSRDGLGAKTRALDVSSTSSIEVEILRANWATLINDALAKAQIQDRVDHRSFKRQGKAIEPTIKLGPIICAIERRAHAKSNSGEVAWPVTEWGRLNGLIKEMRSLSTYIDRGRAFIDAERRKLADATRALAREAMRLSPMVALRRAASEIRFQHGQPQRALRPPKIAPQDRGIER